MKYLTLEYDMNSPVDKAVSAPLDSDYGLAVKVYKDGQPVQSAISVDGAASTETRAGWRLFELSSGSEPRKRAVAVQAAEVIGQHLEHTWTEQVENQYDEPDEFGADFQLSDLFSGETFRLDGSKTKLSAWLDGEGVEEIYVITGYGTTYESSWILDEEKGEWVSAWDETVISDYLDVKNTDVIEALYILSGGQTAELSVAIEIDGSTEGEAVGFKLVVKEKDMGRMDVEEQD